MTASASAEADDIAHHPAPLRERVRFSTLMFAFWGAPLAWSFDTIVNYFLYGHGCYPGGSPRTALLEGWNWAHAAGIAVNVLAIIVCLAAGATGYRAVLVTKGEEDENHQRLMEIGEGRTHFLAVTALITAAGFLLATISAATSFWVPICGH